MAERVADEEMNDATRGEFEELLNEAAVAYTAPDTRKGLTLRDEQRQAAKLETRIKEVAEDVVSFIGGKLQQRIDVTQFIEVANRLHRLSESATIRRHGGRPKLDGRFLEFVMRFGDAWWLGAHRTPGTSSDKEGTRRGGPFVKFVSTAFEFLQGRSAGPAFADRVQRALEEIKKMTGATSWGGK